MVICSNMQLGIWWFYPRLPGELSTVSC